MTYEDIAAFLYREARLLDDRQWDEWIECYAPDATYWMPAWDDDDQLVEDPQAHDLADLLREPHGAGRPYLPHQDRALGRQHA
jgi:benzoate/toluate 1,2-dioxygenase beta subunit